jgi:FKBP-type peptidyl-prolyl cis-trans isomerase SlyD
MTMPTETIVADMVVSMNYTLTDPTGNVLDASKGEPLEYLQGHQNIIPGLERELAGLQAGERKKVVVQPTDGYGEHNADLIFSLPRDQFGGQTPQIGMMVQLQSEEGVMMASIKAVDEQQIMLDANHPLAGQELHFDVEIVAIRPASQEELSHGHPHGPDGHHH